MLKKLQNKYEKITNDQVEDVCKKYDAKAFPKVRLADVFEIIGSGIPSELYTYALMAHFDNIICDSEQNSLFAVEYDGSTHQQDPVQIENDLKKNYLCEHFGLPLLRINSDFLYKQYRDINLLSWFIEVWFASQWFYKAQEEGKFSQDEPFMPMSFQSIQGMKKEYPLWLSRDARGKIAKLSSEGYIESIISPNAVVWVDVNNDYHCLAWVVIDDKRIVFAMNKMTGQKFPVPIHDLLEDITVVNLTEKLINILNGEPADQTILDLNQEITKHKLLYRIVSGGGQQHTKIMNWR